MINGRLVHGPNDELDGLSLTILEQLIPRLLRPMESNGRKLRPSLLYGDLWHGNISVDKNKNPILYDPCAFYSHNECRYPVLLKVASLTVSDEFAPWRAARYLTTREHMHAYHKIVEKTKPAEDRDDHHALYAMSVYSPETFRT